MKRRLLYSTSDENMTAMRLRGMTKSHMLPHLHKAGWLRRDVLVPALSRATLLINLERVDRPVGITKSGWVVRDVVLAGRRLGRTAS